MRAQGKEEEASASLWEEVSNERGGGFRSCCTAGGIHVNEWHCND